MKNSHLLFICFTAFLSFNSIWASTAQKKQLQRMCAKAARKKHKFKGFKTNPQRAARVNKQLEKISNPTERIKIIKHAVQTLKIHPDSIRFKARGVQRTAMEFAFMIPRLPESDSIDLVRFLLDHGAKKIAYNQPVLACARSVEMAQLLASYGAAVDIKKYGTQILISIAAYEHATEVLQYCISLGAPVNGYHPDGRLPIMGVHSAEDAQVLMQNGARLDLKSKHKDTKGLTVPQLLQRDIKELQEKIDQRTRTVDFIQDTAGLSWRIATLKSIKHVLSEEQEKRNMKSSKELLQDVLPIPQLSALTCEYSVGGESYKELEDGPLSQE